MGWGYIATRLNGDGTEDPLDPECPLRGVSITEYRNAPTEISASINPEYADGLDADGNPVIEKWSTAIYAEKDGFIRGGGILVDDSIDGPNLTLDVMGMAGYPNGQPYTERSTWPPNPYPKNGLDPMLGIREVWRHLQAQPGGNLALQVDPMLTGKLIGKQVAQGEFDTENGPLSFEYEPFLLRWFETHDLGEVVTSLCENVPLEFREEHSWNADRTAIKHFLRFGYPRLSTRRQDIQFVIGETVDPVGIDPPVDDYASHVLGLGAGEGAAMLRGDAYRSGERRLRRAVVFENKAARTAASIATSARNELVFRLGQDEVTSIVVRPGHVLDLQHIMPGDEIHLYGEQEHRDVDMWVRIDSKTTLCETDGLEFGVERIDG